jgi:hypothetical protein
MCYSGFAAKGVAYWVKVIRSEVLLQKARTKTSGSDEATIFWCCGRSGVCSAGSRMLPVCGLKKKLTYEGGQL